ncbi:MAG: hypothetical protein ACE5DI_01200 [Candidatus Micrarchaeia archaeon]
MLVFASFFNSTSWQGFEANLDQITFMEFKIMNATIINAKRDAFSAMKGLLEPWYGAVLTKEETQAAIWADKNIPRKELFAADLFACETLTAVSQKTCTIGGAWELADNPNQRFSENEKAFTTNSTFEAYQILKKYNVKYVFYSPRNAFYAYGWKYPQTEKFNDNKYFDVIYDKDEVKILKVK